MKILITGSEGFVGSQLAKRLSDMHHGVRGFDSLLGNDVLDMQAVGKAVQGIDVVFHLAAVLDEKALNLHEVNVQGTLNLLEASAKAKVKRFIYLSTVGVMGDIQGIADETAPYNPKTPYEKSKAGAEKLVLSYQEMLPVTVLRSALVYGPNKYWAGIIKKIKEGFPIVGTGNNMWQMIYVKDLVSALVFVMMREGTIGEVYVVAEQQGMRLKELYAMVAGMLGVEQKQRSISPAIAKLGARLKSLLGSGSGVVTAEHIDRLVRERSYNTAKINSLGWRAAHSTEYGMRETIKELKLQGVI